MIFNASMRRGICPIKYMTFPLDLRIECGEFEIRIFRLSNTKMFVLMLVTCTRHSSVAPVVTKRTSIYTTCESLGDVNIL